MQPILGEGLRSCISVTEKNLMFQTLKFASTDKLLLIHDP